MYVLTEHSKTKERKQFVCVIGGATGCVRTALLSTVTGTRCELHTVVSCEITRRNVKYFLGDHGNRLGFDGGTLTSNRVSSIRRIGGGGGGGDVLVQW